MRCTLLSTPAPAPAPTTRAPVPSGACSDVGENCMVSKCCNDRASTCYEKDLGWAECLRNCKPGIDPEEPTELQSPWTCKVIRAKPVWPAGREGGQQVVISPASS